MVLVAASTRNTPVAPGSETGHGAGGGPVPCGVLVIVVDELVVVVVFVVGGPEVVAGLVVDVVALAEVVGDGYTVVATSPPAAFLKRSLAAVTSAVMGSTTDVVGVGRELGPLPPWTLDIVAGAFALVRIVVGDKVDVDLEVHIVPVSPSATVGTVGTADGTVGTTGGTVGTADGTVDPSTSWSSIQPSDPLDVASTPAD